MKIGLDISQIVYQTGVSRYTAELVKQLLKIDSDNQYVLYAGSLRQRSILKTFTAALPRKTKLILSPLAPKLADVFFNRLNLSIDPFLGPVDIFHASNWVLPRCQAPIIATIHDLTFIKYPEEHVPYYVKAHQRHLNRAKKYAQAIIAVSQATKKDLIEQGISSEKIHVVYEAPSAIFKPTKTPGFKEKYQLNKPFILSVGTQEPRKNLGRLIQAWQPLQRQFDLVIVGKFGWGEAAHPNPGIKLLGFVPDEALAELYSNAAVFVYPSLYEGFGLPVAEALSCGCPVVTSNCSSLPEVGGPVAIYVDPKSITAITQGIKQALVQAPKLRQLGLVQAKRFSWEKTAKETLKIYQEVYDHRS